jgi:hypothetical protein
MWIRQFTRAVPFRRCGAPTTIPNRLCAEDNRLNWQGYARLKHTRRWSIGAAGARGLVGQIAGTIQNALSNITSLLYSHVGSLGLSGDEIFGNGSQIYWAGGSVSLNTLGQVTFTGGMSNSLTGVALGVVAGAGISLGGQSGPSVAGVSNANVVVAGAAVNDVGVLFSGSMDPTSVSLPGPPTNFDLAGGLGIASANGSAQMTTVTTGPRVPLIQPTSCHL